VIERECMAHIPVPNMTVEVDLLTGKQKVWCPICQRNVAGEVLAVGRQNRMVPTTLVDKSAASNGTG
jgi:hypothetical protein